MMGLRDHQVVQRDGEGSATVALSGTSAGPARLAVVDGSDAPIVGWEDVGDGGPWKAELTLPVGGPYDVVVSDDGESSVMARDVLVGDVWLLAGQSNMQGVGRLADGLEEPSPFVHVLDLAREWRLATEPLHRVHDSPDLAHHMYADPEERAAAAAADRRSGVGAGLGVAFGRAMWLARAIPIGLVATAQGGTSLQQWSPAKRGDGGASLFGSLLLSVEAAGGRVAGVLWYQGESDALAMAHDEFPANLRGLVDAIRDEVGQPALPFFHVQLGRVVPGALPAEAVPAAFETAWNAVREAQRVADLGPGGMTTAVDLAISDFIHISTRSLRRLGRRLAMLASDQSNGVRVDGVDVQSFGDVRYEVRIRYGGVVGVLSPPEHIAGFSIRDAEGALVPRIYEVEVDRSDPTAVVVRALGAPEPGHALWYGYGVDPYCNLTDDADMAAPAFGPWPLASADG